MKIEIEGCEADLSLNTHGKELFGGHSQWGGVMRRYGDEMYFLVNFGYEYDSDQSSFEVGDVVYWKSESTWKEAVAFFWGATPIGDGKQPRTPSGAIKIGTFVASDFNLNDLKSGDIGHFQFGS